MTRVLGLDLSLTATGYAYNEEVIGVFKPKSNGMRRLAVIREAVIEWAHQVDIVVLEGYGFHSQKAVALGELGGVIRLALHDRRIPFVDVAPAALKRFATGKGNATKDATLAAAIRRFGFEGDDNNAADAWLLRAMGVRHYDGAAYIGEQPTAYQLDALGKIAWPKLDTGERVG